MRHRITVEEYHRIVDSGGLRAGTEGRAAGGHDRREDDQETAAHPRHATCWSTCLHHRLPRGRGYFALDGRSGGDRGPRRRARAGRDGLARQIRDYAGRRRTPADAALLAEVSDTSYDYDRYAKWVTYAAARVPVYWIIDLNRRQLEVHTEPTGEGDGGHLRPNSGIRSRRRSAAGPRRPRGRPVPREGDPAVRRMSRAGCADR